MLLSGWASRPVGLSVYMNMRKEADCYVLVEWVVALGEVIQVYEICSGGKRFENCSK